MTASLVAAWITAQELQEAADSSDTLSKLTEGTGGKTGKMLARASTA